MVISPTVEAAIIVAFLFCLALFGSYIVFKVLKSTASIKQKGLQLGGAVAGLIVMFVLLNRYMPNIRAELVEDASAQSIHTRTANGVTQIAEVALSPSTQLISKEELAHLDRNAYDILESSGLALPRPDGDSWEIGETKDVSTISMGCRQLAKVSQCTEQFYRKLVRRFFSYASGPCERWDWGKMQRSAECRSHLTSSATKGSCARRSLLK
jgi:hypothetical protein